MHFFIYPKFQEITYKTRKRELIMENTKQNTPYINLRTKMFEILSRNNSNVSDDDILEFSDYFNHEYQEFKDGFKLYRYMPVNYDNIRNLETESIYLSYNGSMNDIYEGIPDFRKDIQTYNKIKSLEDLVLMKCFSESFDIPLMWGHYADSSTGFCIEYNIGNIDSTSEILQHIFPVIYTDKRIANFDLDELMENNKTLNCDIFQNAEPDGYFPDIYKLFLLKGNDWSYEQEWRILYSKYELYKNNYDWEEKRKICLPCTSAIYLGAKMHPKYKEHIQEIVERLNSNLDGHREKIKIYEMKLNNKFFKFDFE